MRAVTTAAMKNALTAAMTAEMIASMKNTLTAAMTVEMTATMIVATFLMTVALKASLTASNMVA